MNISDTIRRELKNLDKKSTDKKLMPINRECAAIPCAYLGVGEEICEQFYKPQEKECAAIPCAYLGVKDKECH